MIFLFAGMGNGSTYRMIPSIFAARGLATDALPGTPAGIEVQRRAAAALGLVSAIGAYGGFLVPQVLNVSQQTTGGYTRGLYGFVCVYGALMIMTVLVYVIPRPLARRAADLIPMTPPSPLRVVLVGFGPVGARFAEELLPAVAGMEVALTVVGAERCDPYNRVMVAEFAVGDVERDELDLVDAGGAHRGGCRRQDRRAGRDHRPGREVSASR